MMQSSKRRTYQKPVVVAGATGSQGGAVARRLLERGHRVRALTRDPHKASARALADAGAEVVRADLLDPASLGEAMRGAGAVFSVQDFMEAGVDVEQQMGFNLTAATTAAAVEHIVYSGASTQDRNTGVPHLDSKWQVELRVRALSIPWTVFRPAAFMDNLEWERQSILDEGVLRLPLRPSTRYRQVAVRDIATVVVNALEFPEIWTGRIAPLAGDVSTPLELTSCLSRVTGRTIRYEQMSWTDCLRTQGEDLTAMYRYFDEFGMDGDASFLRRWHPDALSFEGYLREQGWDRPPRDAQTPRA